MLLERFEEVETKEAVCECGNLKSPRPNGLNFKFIKHFWYPLKDDVERFLQEFQQNGMLPRRSNASSITLIPKVDDPQCLNEFRPISLVGCMYKVLAKILANRLKKVLSEVIDKKIKELF